MSGSELAGICRQAGVLTREVGESRWAGFAHLKEAPPPRKASADRSPSGKPASRVPRASAAKAAPAAAVKEAPGPTLEEIALEVKNCRRCPLHETRTQTVFGEGSPRADLMFVGEGPGGEEDRLGRPFVGRAGALLDTIITKGMGLAREEVFIANVVKCRPPGNRNPEKGEVDSCLPYLYGQIDRIRPRVIVALGKYAAQALLENKAPISRLRGQFFDYRGIKLMPTFHPSYLLRNEADKPLVWEDIQKVMALLGLQRPKDRS